MEGIAPLPGSLGELTARHPEITACCVEGTWHGWIPAGDGRGAAGSAVHGRDEAELLAKLTAALGG